MKSKLLGILLSCACLSLGNSVSADKLSYKDLVLDNRLKTVNPGKMDRTLMVEIKGTKIEIFDKNADGVSDGDYVRFWHVAPNNDSIEGEMRKEGFGAYVFQYTAKSGNYSFTERKDTRRFDPFSRAYICANSWSVINYGEAIYRELTKHSPEKPYKDFPLDEFNKIVDGVESNIPLLARRNKKAGNAMFELGKKCAGEAKRRLEEIRKLEEQKKKKK